MTRHDDGPDGRALSLRDEQKRLTRRRLIEGALAAFERKGYAATTIDDIVAEANASRATFYLHFKSKADVVLVVTETLGRRWRELYVELTSGGRLSRDELYEWLDGMVENYQTNRASLDAIDHAVAIEPEVAEVGWPPAGDDRCHGRVHPALVRRRRGRRPRPCRAAPRADGSLLPPVDHPRRSPFDRERAVRR